MNFVTHETQMFYQNYILAYCTQTFPRFGLFFLTFAIQLKYFYTDWQ